MTDHGPQKQLSPDLLPCPFCGSKADLWRSMRTTFSRIVCSNKDCIVRAATPYGIERIVIEGWNTRHSPPTKGQR